jgi:hypothetical protein
VRAGWTGWSVDRVKRIFSNFLPSLTLPSSSLPSSHLPQTHKPNSNASISLKPTNRQTHNHKQPQTQTNQKRRENERESGRERAKERERKNKKKIPFKPLGGNPLSFFLAKIPQRMAKRTRKMLRESQLFLTVLGQRTRKVRERNGRTAKKRKAKVMIGTITMSRERERE